MLSLCSCDVFDDSEKLNDRGIKALAEKDYTAASTYFQRAAGSLERHMSGSARPDKPQDAGVVRLLCTVWGNLGKAKMGQGAYSEAVEWYQKALDTYEKQFGKDDAFTAGLMASLSFCLFHLEKYDQAAKLAERELKVYESNPGSNALRIAVTANNLAQLLEKLDRLDEAERYFQWALNLVEKGSKKDSCIKAEVDILNNYALFCRRNQDYERAKQLAERALSLQDHCCTGYSADKVKALFVLAGIESETYDTEAAEEHYEEGLELIEEHGGDSQLLSEGLDLYAELLLSERRFAEAEPQLRRSLELTAKLHGPNHPVIADRLTDLAMLMRRTGRLEEAEKYLRRAEDIDQAALGVDSRAYIDSVARLAAVLEDEHKYMEAYQIYGDLVDALTAKLGKQHPYVADALDNWAIFADKLGSKAESEKLQKEAKAIRGSQGSRPVQPSGEKYVLPGLKTRRSDFET